VFVEIVTKSKTCHIYKAVLLTIKVVACDASRAHRETQAMQPSTQRAKQSIAKYNKIGRRVVTPREGLNQSKSRRVPPFD
jgi:hypothetical protein